MPADVSLTGADVCSSVVVDGDVDAADVVAVVVRLRFNATSSSSSSPSSTKMLVDVQITGVDVHSSVIVVVVVVEGDVGAADVVVVVVVVVIVTPLFKAISFSRERCSSMLSPWNPDLSIRSFMTDMRIFEPGVGSRQVFLKQQRRQVLTPLMKSVHISLV